MTLNNRMASHRLLKRQGGNGPSSSSGSSTTGSTSTTTPTGGPGGNSPTGPSTSSTSTTSTSATSAKTHKSSGAISQTSTSDTTSSSTSSTLSPTSTSSSTTTSATTVPVQTTPSSIPVVATLTAPAVTQTQLPVPNTFSTSLSSATASASTTATSSGTNTGVIVGSVAGAIVGLAVLAIIIAFFVRRWRRRDENPDLDFNPADFVSPSTDYPATRPISTFDPSPPNMTQRDRDSTLGPGMAGHGAYPYAAGAGATLHERQNYVYGTQVGMREEDVFGGPYSSQPQPQSAYNPEAYGSYAHPSADNYGNGVRAPPALVPGAHAIPANRSTRSLDNEDAYGGF